MIRKQESTLYIFKVEHQIFHQTLQSTHIILSELFTRAISKLFQMSNESKSNDEPGIKIGKNTKIKMKSKKEKETHL